MKNKYMKKTGSPAPWSEAFYGVYPVITEKFCLNGSGIKTLREVLKGGAKIVQLREKDYPGIFSLLAAELPPIGWETLRVNPTDAEIAADLFPRARIVPDTAICGGMEALAEEGRIRIINTLEKRLERVWPELLPALIEETEQCVN